MRTSTSFINPADGSGITGINASNISTGTLADGRLPTTMAGKTLVTPVLGVAAATTVNGNTITTGTTSGTNTGDQTSLPAVFSRFADAVSTSTNGDEDNLYTNTLTAGLFSANGVALTELEHVSFVSSATASRRLKKYFAGTLIFDSGSLTLSLGGEFTLETTVIRVSAAVVRCSVAVTSTSASSVPYATFSEISGLTLANTQILKTTGIAAGAGAASGDIKNKMAVARLSSP